MLTLAVALVGVLILLTVWMTRRAELSVPPRGEFIDLAQARLHVLDRGSSTSPDAPALVLIHGLGGQLCHFSYALIEELAQSHRVIAFDRPGSGYSCWRTKTVPTLEAQADVVVSLLDFLRLDKVVLVGHSLGGALALSTALRHRERVVSMALLAPLTQLPEAVPPAFRALLVRGEWLRWLIAWTLAIPLGRWQRHRVLKTIFAPDTVPVDFGTRGGGNLALRPGHFVAATRDLAAIPESLEAMITRYGALGHPKPLPIGVLFGRQDQILPAALHGERFTRDLSHARLELIDAGHMLPITQSAACADFIRRYA